MASRFHNLAFVRAKAELLARAALDDEIADDEAENFLLREGLSLEEALKIMGKKSELVLSYDDGKLFAVEYGRKDHGKVAAKLVDEIRDQLPSPGILDHGANEDIVLNNHAIKQPDESLTPYPRAPTFLEPSLVVEVAVSESLKSLLGSATHYLQLATGVQIVLAVKLWKRRTVNAGYKRRMLFMCFIRNNVNPTYVGPPGNVYLAPIHTISFGNSMLMASTLSRLNQWGIAVTGYHRQSNDPICLAAGMQEYRITLPSALIFHGALALIPPPLLNGVNLDLHPIQDRALTYAH